MMNRYLEMRYVRYGRGPVGVDCYGIVRLARHDLFALPMLPSYDNVSPDDKRSLTAACVAVRDDGGFKPVDPFPSAIATAWQGGLCIHVGLVVEADGRQWVLEINEATGPCITPLPKFEARYTKVIYYAD